MNKMKDALDKDKKSAADAAKDKMKDMLDELARR
jgi:hypothetical protein